MNPSSLKSELEVVHPPPETDGDFEDRRHVHDHAVARLRLLLSQRRLLLRAAGMGLLFATVFAFLIPSRYDSTTRLMPPDDSSSASMTLMAALNGKMNGGLGSIAGDLLGVKSSGALFIGILRSRTVQDNLIQKFDLRRIYSQPRWEGAREVLDNNTAISEDRKTGIITIAVNDHSPQRAADLAQQYIVELNAVVNQLSTSSARRERIFLEQRLAQVKQDLEAAEKDFSEFASKNATIDIKEQGKAMVGAAATLQGELMASESELQGLKQIYTDNNVRVRSLKARVAELQNQLGKLGGKEGVGTDPATEKDGSLYPSIRKLPLLGVSYADLYRRTRIQEAVFETLTQEYELAKVTEAKELPSVKVLDPANIPEKKSFPPRLTIMFLGAFLSLGCAVVWILGKARWQETDRRDPGKILLQEVFQTVNAGMPWSPPNGSRLQAASHKVWVRWVQRDVSSGKPE